MRIRRYCLTHDSLQSKDESDKCETFVRKHWYIEGKCDFIEVEIMRMGRKRLHDG